MQFAATTTAAVPGDYPIAPSGLTSTDYVITFVNGVLKIAADRAIFLFPLDHTLELNTTQPFTWLPYAGAQAYLLLVGTSIYGFDLVSSGALPPTQSSYMVPDLPADRPLWATLSTEVNSTWTRYQTVTFQASPGHATFTNPLDGQQHANTANPFTWAPSAGAQGYYLTVGTTLYGSNLVNSGVIPASQTSLQMPALPSGPTLYATLFTATNGAWTRFQSITFRTVPMAIFTYPVDGQANVVGGALVWIAAPGAQGYYLTVGTSPYGNDLVNSGVLPPSQTTLAMPTLPAGKTLYATLFTAASGTWASFQTVTFTD